VPGANELIITFHGLGEPPATATAAERRVWVPVEWLAELAALAPRQGLSFAFDDGNISDVEQALPILAERGLAARFFVLAGRLDEDGYLSAEDVAQLHNAGMRIGSHGLEHRDWRTLNADELRSETLSSRTLLGEVIGAPVTEAACPFGSYDRRVLGALRTAGYERVFTSDGGPGTLGAAVMPRTSVNTSRPLEHWLAVAAAAPSSGAGLVPRAKRLLKRLR
jgi:peptidoglycan/xylan/chitin deacetylase (PgdA/CDA1 family)